VSYIFTTEHYNFRLKKRCFGVHPLCGCLRRSLQFRHLRSEDCTVKLCLHALTQRAPHSSSFL